MYLFYIYIYLIAQGGDSFLEGLGKSPTAPLLEGLCLTDCSHVSYAGLPHLRTFPKLEYEARRYHG